MRHLLTALFLFFASFVSAQIVNIPDPVFKQALLDYQLGFLNPVIDTNGDGEIQLSEALAVDTINISDNPNHLYIRDFTGIRSFANLSYFIATSVYLDSLDLSGLTKLKTLGMSNRSDTTSLFTSMNLTGCNDLEIIEISNSKFSSLDFSHLQNLKDIRLVFQQQSMLSKLHFEGMHRLKSVVFAGWQAEIQHFSVVNCDSLYGVQINAGIDTIDISNTASLISCYFLSGLHINKVFCRQSNIRSLTFDTQNSNPPSPTEQIDLTGTNKLEYINFKGFLPRVIDFSTSPNLKRMYLNHEDLSNTFINLKNGSKLDTLGFLGSGSINMCADDVEISRLYNWVIPYATGTVNISPFCTLFPGGNYNLIRGKINVDVDNNGCNDNDPPVPNIPVKLTNNGTGEMITVSTNAEGRYAHYPYAGNFTVTPHLAYPHFSITPLNTNISFDTANNLIDTAAFCVIPNGVHQNLEINFLPFSSANPGRAGRYLLTFKSRSTTLMSGDIQLNFENGRMIFGNSSVPVSSQNIGQLAWNYNNLQPFETRTIEVNFTMLAPPANNIGDTIYFLAQINPVASDETVADNIFILPQIFTGPYDPNEKECLQGNKIDITAIDDYLHYSIRFQNLGTDTAFNVVITDTLSNNADWDSFDFMSSSHPVVFKQKGNKLEFDFENIKLPYKAINEPGSQGFVAYKVKPKHTLSVGDSVNNTASIYFDFNPPIVTNKTTTIVSSFAPTPVRLEYFSLSSREQSNLLTWKVATTDLSTTFSIERSNDGIHFNNIGNITATAQRCLLPFNFTDDKTLTGKNYYRIKITDANGISFYSKILVTGKTRSGFEITAIASDQNNTTLYMIVSKDQQVQIKIIAADGRMVYSQSKTIAAGTIQLDLQTGNLLKGIYTLVVNTKDGELITKRFIK